MRWPPIRPTVRVQLTAAATLATLLMLVVASVAILTIQRRSLVASVDEGLRQSADNVQPVDASPRSLPGEGDPEDSFAQLIDRRGAVVASSPNVAGEPASVAIDPTGPWFDTVDHVSPTGRFRVLATPVRSSGPLRFLAVGKNLDDVDQSMDSLRLTLAGVVPVLVLLIGALASWLTGRTLRPVDAIRREVDVIHADDLHRRVPVPNTDDEIADLARTMNEMLERVESASIRQQQFTEDASHELRTPLTRLITDLEVSLAHDATEAPQTTMRRLLDEATSMDVLIRDLLYLARGTERLPIVEDVDLDDLAWAAAGDMRARSSIPVDTTGISAARVRGDPGALARAVANLLENAVRHARSRVAISTVARGGQCLLAVDDDGPGIAPVDRDRVFERFTRLDQARGRALGGAGLGLAIVRDITERHGGIVIAQEAPLGGARLMISIPSADEPVGG